jgi:hypothetical protein
MSSIAAGGSSSGSVRLLVKNVPTTCVAEEVYDALRCHHGGYALSDALLVPTSSGQTKTCAIAEYSSNAAATAAQSAALFVDGERCQFQSVGPAAVGPVLREPDVVVDLLGLRQGVTPLEVFNAFRQYSDVVNVLTNASHGAARVMVRPEGVAALTDAVTRGAIIPGIRLMNEPVPRSKQHDVMVVPSTVVVPSEVPSIGDTNGVRSLQSAVQQPPRPQPHAATVSVGFKGQTLRRL